MLKLIGKRNNEDLDFPTFDLATIIAATNDFSPANMIGVGGFGPVYKVSVFFQRFYRLFLDKNLTQEVYLYVSIKPSRGHLVQDKKLR